MTQNKMIVADGQEPLAGLRFEIIDTKFSETASGKSAVTLHLGVNGPRDRMRLAIDMILSGWDFEPTDQPSVYFWWGDARLRGLGEDTARWVGLLEQCFGVSDLSPDPAVFRQIFCTCVALCCDPLDIRNTPFCGKLFFGHADAGDQAAQVFLTVDLPNRTAWFSEKDPEYRPALLQWLRGNYE